MCVRACVHDFVCCVCACACTSVTTVQAPLTTETNYVSSGRFHASVDICSERSAGNACEVEECTVVLAD